MHVHVKGKKKRLTLSVKLTSLVSCMYKNNQRIRMDFFRTNIYSFPNQNKNLMVPHSNIIFITNNYALRFKLNYSSVPCSFCILSFALTEHIFLSQTCVRNLLCANIQ